MDILVWNVRGLNKKERRRDITYHVHKFSPSIVGLVETKVRPNKSYRIIRSLPADWNHVHNYEFSNKGRIWFSWNTSIWSCQVICVSLQQITVHAINKGGLDIVLSIVHGENWISMRDQL